MGVKNSTILEKCWLEGGNDFQQRIPNPQIAGYDSAIEALFEPFNHDMYNQFANALVGIMGTYVESKRFENPLRELIKPAKTYGNTERHVAFNYLKAHSYKVDSETLLKVEKPDFQEWFYSVKEPRQYSFSWSKFEMRRVLSGGDSTGLEDLLIGEFDAMFSADELDTFEIMVNLFAYADKHFPLARHKISKAPSDKATSQELLTAIRAGANRMRFPSTLYNALDIPTFDKADTLCVWLTPESAANIDVMALADLLNSTKAEIKYKTFMIPEFPIPGIEAALTSTDFIFARDFYYGVEPPFYNSENMTYKYYLHDAKMIGINPLANCLLFTTNEVTVPKTVQHKLTALAFDPATLTCEIGGEVQTNLKLTGTVSPESSKISPKPNAATYSISAARGATPLQLNSKTYMSDDGILHVQSSGLNAGDVITINAVSSYVNPSGETPELKATCKVTLKK